MDGKFLFDTELIHKLNHLIRNSKKNLYLISPFIDLDNRTKDALIDKKKNPNFKLFILFGKNESNIYKSVKNDSIDFLKEFPNIEIRYNARLHAKFYLNENHFIMTSMNLYDYSLSNNIESGIYVCHTPDHIMKKIDNNIGDVLDTGIGSIRKYFSSNLNSDETEPISRFISIFENSELLFKSEPKFSETKTLGIITSKKFERTNIVLDKLDTNKLSQKNITTSNTITKYYSATKFCQISNLSKNQFELLVEKKGLVKNNIITDLGKQNGIIIKTYMGKEYIAYPADLEL